MIDDDDDDDWLNHDDDCWVILHIAENLIDRTAMIIVSKTTMDTFIIIIKIKLVHCSTV